MYYLLYEPSCEYVNNEHFVLFQTDAHEELSLRFIEYYFNNYQILGIFPNYISYDSKVVPLIKINENEILDKFDRQRVKNETEQEFRTKLHNYLLPYYEVINELKVKLKKTEEEMNRTIFKSFDPSEVTTELTENLKSKGYFYFKRRNGKARFRIGNHEEVRKEFEEKLRNVRLEIKNAEIKRSIKSDEFREMNPIDSFDDVNTYERTSF